jgi:hypothetical protein
VGIRLLVLSVFCFLVACTNSTKTAINENQNNPHVIYGDDDRQEHSQVSDPALKELARSTVALIANDKMVFDSVFSVYSLENPDDHPRRCPTERFVKQSDWAFCSGALIAPDLVLTAGHCIHDDKICQKTKFVFDYTLTHGGDRMDSVKAENVFDCKEVVYSTDQRGGTDFAIIRLEREATGRTPLALSEKPVVYDDKLMMIGHPAGYPTKFTFNGEVRSLLNDHFMVVELDALAGNSGSSVLDQTTHQVVGVLVRGEADYDYQNGCLQSKVCGKGECRGEDVTRIEVIKKFIPKN